MKKISILVLILINIFLGAKEKNISEILRMGETFLQSKNKTLVLESYFPIEFRGKTLAYIVNYQPETFVAISADDRLYPIIAYSFNNNIKRNQNEYHLPNLLWEDLFLRLKFYEKFPEKAEQNKNFWQTNFSSRNSNRDFQQWPAEGSTSTDGWVETRWHQSGIYDNFCPLDNSDERSKVGCVATAMAQIVNFHEFIGNPPVTFSNSDDYYAGGGIDIDDDHNSRDFPSFPELNNYLLDLWNHYEHDYELTDNDKAALSFACGVSVEMQYSSNGSSASTSAVGYNLRNKFDFVSGFYYSMYTNFYTDLQQDMKQMQPAQLSVYNPEEQLGHSIICDGYNTDNYFHLNMGWGISNETCWYLLPSDIPDGYSIINGAVMNIEGGEIPVHVTGNVIINGASAPGTYITLAGERFYETYVTLYSGDFEFPAVSPGNYTATAIREEGRVYFQSFDVHIDENNDFLQFNLGHFEAVTGIVNAPISPNGTNISFYRNGELINSGIADENGEYAVADILPGEYLAVASLNGNFFESKAVTISLENQTVDFNLEEYPANIAFAYSSSPTGTWNFVPNYTLTCAVRLSDEELENITEDVFAKIRFKSPINNDEGEIFAQIWNGDYLISETQVENFSAGEWLEVELDNFVPINMYSDYYVGYQIQSSTGEFVFHDAGPRVSGKGAFYRNSGWTELVSQNDYNFCIEPIIISQDFGTITGNVVLSGGNGDVTETSVKAGNFITHPLQNGDYFLDVKPANYDLSATLTDYDGDYLNDISVTNGETLENQNFTLVYNPSAAENEAVVSDFIFGNYPNPFPTFTTIFFSLPAENFDKKPEIEIFNTKGQLVKKYFLSNNKFSIKWDGKDQNGNAVESGIYFYKFSWQPVSTGKMILLK